MTKSAIDPETLPYRSCVGIMVLNRASKIWVGRRADAPGDAEATWWQMPQGGIDEHEDPRLAALRELREETSMTNVEFLGESENWLAYDLPVELIPKVWGGRYRGQRQKWFAVRFVGDESEIDLGVPGHPHTEFIAWRWSTIEELPAAIVPFKRDLYLEVLRQFSPFLAQN
ncbi:MAG: RNA pyrophosphohydrolase [Hyphomicrobium sp.]|jgi:putative (di)nucleoside polyphosphate hydrolase|uniref:RNA pyrophosphohydrolase n=1 Tax=Hyphomicrobium sp. TaxID=82 RepID=UPI0025B7F5E3|nr:RNA pyrophosphohydrolase [Hyphomicrobium sp.]MBX9863817.1 RNA pyrophosphohydrolase [Hyphomicrobium sp.]